jgi:hypothetical protein
MNYLSKSDYKISHTCPTKLYYWKNHYPNLNDQNEYLAHLAKGGYMVGKLATLFYPTGITIDTGSDHETAIKKTQEYLNLDNVVLFEAAIESKGKLIRVDILEKKGEVINLIEVKSKLYESTTDKKKESKILKELEEYIIDVAYQYLVIKEVYPEWKITPYLYLPDKSKNTQIAGLNSLFQIKDVSVANSKFKKYDVIFNFDYLDEVIKDNILTLVNVEKDVKILQPQIQQEIIPLLESINGEIKKINKELDKDCFKCEFNLTDEKHFKSGFNECWEIFPNVENHIKDLSYIGSIGGYKNPLANSLINQKKISFEQFPLEELKDGPRSQRQKIQINYTIDKKEWLSDNLRKELNKIEFPIHFVDFETTSPALPMNKGMRPYEVITFQWSCHTINSPDDQPIHTEWIDLEPTFPNFRFAEALMNTIGNKGTPLMWAPYENTILKTIYDQMVKYGYQNSELKEWLEYMIKFNKGDQGRFVDMNKITSENYFHPAMKGKTSIKWTLPAVLKSNTLNTIEILLDKFEPGLSLLKKDEYGFIIDPYKLLPTVEIYEIAESIKDGTGAMRAYEEIMFGLSKDNNDVITKYKLALLRYCKLDTLAMLLIWLYWNNK